ncbi:MAG: ATP-binding protein [Phycisphaeraceae bacterium]|nr:ATP-binding protein [Phycisphaeraceae bacterium]
MLTFLLTSAAASSGGGLILFLSLAVLAALVVLWRLRGVYQDRIRQHEQTITNLQHRANELEATLSSMVEGVLAVDTNGRLINLNAAAIRLLDIHQGRVAVQPIERVIGHEGLRRFINQSLETDDPIQADIELPRARTPLEEEAEPAKRLFQVQGAALRNTEGRRIGSLIVLHDVTRLRRLEVIRSDFVTNASHEIKTPVSAIKAAAETLIDAHEQDESAVKQFLPIIARQADRLGAIIEDLLTLTRMERDEGEPIEAERGRVADLLRAVTETCQAGAREKNITLQTDCPDDLSLRFNAPLLEQALVNLLDNAVKYSPSQATVFLKAHIDAGHVVLSVRDEGPGIGPEHLNRIFERFYRTDKARSRELGGTGLGLSIVKHIALAHGGHVSVDSVPGHGSTFRIHLPVG